MPPHSPQALLERSLALGDLSGCARAWTQGADLDARDAFGIAPVERAIAHGHLSLITWLARHGANLQARDAHGMSPAARCVMRGDCAALRTLASWCADFNRHAGERGLLELALRSDSNGSHEDVIRYLVRHGVDTLDANEDGTLLLDRLLAAHLHAGAIRLARELPATHTALGARRALAHLLEHGPRVAWRLAQALASTRELDGSNPLIAACEAPDDAALMALLLDAAHAPRVAHWLNRTDPSGNRPLHLAIGRGFHRAIEPLSRHGADMNAVNRAGDAPLHIAIRRGDAVAVTLLLVRHANPTLRDGAARTPRDACASRAASPGMAAIDALLVEASADRTSIFSADNPFAALVRLSADNAAPARRHPSVVRAAARGKVSRMGPAQR